MTSEKLEATMNISQGTAGNISFESSGFSSHSTNVTKRKCENVSGLPFNFNEYLPLPFDKNYINSTDTLSLLKNQIEKSIIEEIFQSAMAGLMNPSVQNEIMKTMNNKKICDFFTTKKKKHNNEKKLRVKKLVIKDKKLNKKSDNDKKSSFLLNVIKELPCSYDCKINNQDLLKSFENKI
jgi:hypothetical protein